MQHPIASESVDHQRLHLLFQQSRIASILSLIGATACALLFWSGTGSASTWVWWTGIAVTTMIRLHFYRRYFRTKPGQKTTSYWLRNNTWQAVLIGIAWGTLPLLTISDTGSYLFMLEIMVPSFVLMAAISSYGVVFSQYLALWAGIGVTAIASRLYVSEAEVFAESVLMAIFLLVLLLTARRYEESIKTSIEAQHRSEHLVDELTAANNGLAHRNELMAQQQDLLEQEEELAKHVFQQLIVGGDHKLPGVHTWNQPMGSLSGDLIQTARGPGGEAYVFLGDFTGHGLPAALGALPASSVFLAMSAKGLPVDTIARELNRKLRELLPVGYFCCAVLVQLSADRTRATVWNGGLPPVLVKRRGQEDYEQIASHALPLGVIDDSDFDSDARLCAFEPGDALYAYTDGLTEAENIDGDMWGRDRLHDFLQRPELGSPKLPALIDAVLEHVNLAPPSDDISVVEIEANPRAAQAADAA